MSITTYNKKRNFKKTQEPRGTKVSISRAEEKKFASLRSTKETLTFVIHEHDASHHHFDLRLEYGGVLKSWALPKTLSTDPAVKRMAVEVEDHPLAYGVFEGTIPEGEYGAGHVKIWDSGEWTNESNFTIEQSFKKGHLHFRLSGKGSPTPSTSYAPRKKISGSSLRRASRVLPQSLALNSPQYLQRLRCQQ